ncbi:MAG: SPASM domain-containing protein [Deltaproteobacteria bacterium]|nr:SPASM domain-containing protein [Deltaproteobacteria bacterium]MBI4223741.1 SPASM domain-containing protein [Deltaproteobacteria bacterium]
MKHYSGGPWFRHLEVDVSGVCNRSCIFCPRYDSKNYPNVKEFFPLDLWEKVSGELGGYGYNHRIAFSGTGEPLFHKQIERLIAVARAEMPSVQLDLITNGDILKAKKMRSLIDAGLSRILISLYDGPFQHEKFDAMAAGVGLTREQVVCRVRYLAKEENFGLELSNRGGIADNKEAGMDKPPEPRRRTCYYPFYFSSVDFRGNVLLCPHDWPKHLIIGNLRQQTFAGIWNSETMKKVRQKMFAVDIDFLPCSTCTVNGQIDGKQYFEQWAQHYAGR